MKLINIGSEHGIRKRVIAIVSPESSIKRIVTEARDRGMLIDATYGRTRRDYNRQRPCCFIRTSPNSREPHNQADNMNPTKPCPK